MTTLTKILLPLALLLGACDTEEPVAAVDEASDQAAVQQTPAAEGRRGGRMAKLDTDKDGAVSLAEARGTRLAARFTALDADRDGKLTRDELRAMKGERGERGHGKRGEFRGAAKDPAARAAKILEKRDADKNGSLSPAELTGTRLADRFTALDTDRDGALESAELSAMKGGHGKHGKHGKRGGHGKRGAKMFEKRDADRSGTLSQAEVAGSRLADKFAEIDADRNGALAKDELVAYRAARRAAK